MRFKTVQRLRFSEFLRPDGTDLDEDPEALRRRDEARRKYFAFTSLAAAPAEGALYCGMTNFANDLLYRFDPATGEFESMGYPAVAEPAEIKIHRGLWLAADGWLYSATSCLTDIDGCADAPGGKVFRFDPQTRRLDVLGVPAGHLYIQTVTLDYARGRIYGMTLPAFEFFAFDIRARQVLYRRYVGSINHVGALDDDGGYWGTWLMKSREHVLFRYDPDDNRIAFHRHGFATPCRSLMYHGAGPVDSMVNGGDGYLYVGHESGELYRIDPRSAEVEYLCKPLPGKRMPGLIAAEDNLLIGVGGNDAAAMGFAYDRKTRRCENLGRILDPQAQADCYRTHDCCLLNGDLYVGETDNPRRSCYLWKCALDQGPQ